MSLLTKLIGDVSSDPVFIRSRCMAESDFDFVRELVKWRELREMTQAQVAELMGVTTQAVSKFERYDGDHKLSTIRRYANAVGVMVSHTVNDDALGQISNPDSEWNSEFARPIQLSLYRGRSSRRPKIHVTEPEKWIAG